MKPGRLFANGFIIAAMYASAWPFLKDLTTDAVAAGPVPNSLKLLVGLSAVMNIIVIVYHYAVPPHPKFLMVPWRKAILRVHITSGTCELLAGLWALTSSEPFVASRLMAAAALLFHVPSAFAQTPIVFGARAIMRPGYLMCIGLHAFCAVQLWLHPMSAYWVAVTFLVFNVYVWCRIYYYVFDKLGLFAGARYSISILGAGLTTTPAILGPNAIVVLAGGVVIYMVLARVFFVRSRADWAEMVREKARDSALPDEVRGLFAGSSEADLKAADAFFDHLDADKDGQLSLADVKALLVDAALSASLVDRFFQTKIGSATSIDRATFKERLWPLREVRDRAFITKALGAAKSERDKAELVFARLDVDGDGKLGRLELESLLKEWSMPQTEVDRWLQRSGTTDKGYLTLEDFQKHLRPVWRFVYYDVVEAQHGRREDMIVRAVTAASDANAQAKVRQAVYRELAQRVPFLAEGGPALLDEVSSSLVEEKLAAGAELFKEGAPGDTFYLVRQGHVRVTRKGERLAELSTGDYLGEGALLTTSARSATATAVGPTRVLSMTRASFSYLVEKHEALKASVARLHAERFEEARLVELHQGLQRELLGTVPFLAEADEPLLKALVEALVRRELAADEVVFREGDAGDAFYLVGAGAVRIIRGDEPLAEIGAGGWFGEGALLSGESRMASAVAAQPAVLYSLPKLAFERVLKSYQKVGQAIVESHEKRRRHLVRGLLERSLLRKVPFLRDASPELLDAMVQELAPVTARAGDTLMTEGEAGDRLFLLVRGAVRVDKGSLAVAELGDGSFFGERALLESQPRAATVVAVEPTELLTLSRDAVERITQKWPQFKQQLSVSNPRPSRPRALATEVNP